MLLSFYYIDLWRDMHHNMYWGSWIIPDFVYFCVPLFEETLVWYFMSSVNFICWVHYGFMWMVHGVFHTLFEIKESRFCFWIHVATEAHGEMLKIIASLYIDVNEYTSPVIDWYSMWFINFFVSSSMIVVSMKSVFSNYVSTSKDDCWNFTSSFSLVPQHYWIIFFMMWSAWSILIPYLPWIMWMLRSFRFDTSCKV